jgi:hypothetical protein
VCSTARICMACIGVNVTATRCKMSISTILHNTGPIEPEDGLFSASRLIAGHEILER